jgi:hypothetical protein
MAKAKFEYFNSGADEALNEFEGDYMIQNGEYVSIWNETRSGKHNDNNEQVVALRLSPSQFVRKM